VQIIIL